ncbi:thioesterase II family protein [Micromonospora sp. DT228]|uniref:thioesterase II family protein n=1 Tax=Micromonospora sp. DT228 TaxID=3393443 RepID=UPI003CE73231
MVNALTLYCLPYAGGSARVFADWADSLPPGVTLDALELPGRGLRFHEDPVDRLEPLVAELLGAVLSRPGQRFAVLGYSYGSLLAFELCRRLEHYYGLVAEHLFVAAMRAPGVPRVEPPVSALPDDLFREHIRSLGGTPPEVLEHDALMEILLPVLRADFTVVDDYSYHGLPVSCPVTAFGGFGDVGVDPDALTAWTGCTTGPFALEMFPGDHFFLRTARDELLSRLAGALAPIAGPTPLRRRA